jgi:hypothetical protein
MLQIPIEDIKYAKPHQKGITRQIHIRIWKIRLKCKINKFYYSVVHSLSHDFDNINFVSPAIILKMVDRRPHNESKEWFK